MSSVIEIKRTFRIILCNPEAFNTMKLSIYTFPAFPDRNPRDMICLRPRCLVRRMLMFSRQESAAYSSPFLSCPPKGNFTWVRITLRRQKKPDLRPLVCLRLQISGWTLRLAHQLISVYWNCTQTGESHRYQMHSNWWITSKKYQGRSESNPPLTDIVLFHGL